MKEVQPSPTQLKALKLAEPSGGLRRFPGGYWIPSDAPIQPASEMYAGKEWVGTATVTACCSRGWMLWGKSDLVALITPIGRRIVREDTP